MQQISDCLEIPKSTVASWLVGISIPKPATRLGRFEKGYLAGMVDAEGWLRVNKNRGRYTHAFMAIANGHLQTLLSMQKQIGGRLIKRHAKDNWKDCYTLEITGRLREILPQIRRMLIVKEAVCNLIFRFWEEGQQGRKGKHIDETELKRRREIFEKIEDLNDRGPTRKTLPTKTDFLLKKGLTKEEFGYVSAIIDGEGYIGTIRRGASAVASMSITNCCFDLLSRVQAKIGGTIYTKSASDRTRQTFVLVLRGENIRKALCLIRPGLSVKKRQANLVLSLWNGDYGINKSRWRTNDAEKIRRLNVHEQLKVINCREV